MLIDTTHPEETRVVILNGGLLEDYDVEVEAKRQLKGNIYLSKVVRVEPSLQAAFVDYGGNRHGFLAFNEIHPDYYQIPVADREALVAEHDAAEQADKDKDNESDGGLPSGEMETIGGDDAEEVAVRRTRTSSRSYKIQEVIKRNQILLVQVVKEERGSKGAALTTYLSLAGRYCVLMPNTARGGGISRKISSGAEREKFKSILGELGIPKGMAVIVRTAGADHSKAEIKRDYECLLKLWDAIRELTLKSNAPSLIHEEGNLIKRTLRDLYNNEIKEIIVDGDEGYRAAKDFMKLMIPSHAKKVQPYTDASMPMLQRFQVESQLDTIHNPIVQLKSGGYIVINPTEALVAIDVNSGRSTKERNIEETALKTNLEAVDEIAHQVRLRDLSGLIVIDLIDMEVSRNNTKVERRLKDAMRSDRARIQLGRISPFGLLEFSRQRLRPSLIETSSEPCPYCEGSGVRRSTDSAALFVLRAIEEEGAKGRAAEILVHTSTAVALYILNRKRPSLADIESRNNMVVLLAGDDTLIPPECRIEQTRIKTNVPTTAKKIVVSPFADDDDNEVPANKEEDGGKEDGGKERRPSRRRRRKRPDEEQSAVANPPESAAGEPTAEKTVAETTGDESGPGSVASPTGGKRRRRGRRGGRRRSRRPGEAHKGAVLPVAGNIPAPNALLEGPAEVALLEKPPETVMIVTPDGVIKPETVKEASEITGAATADNEQGPAPRKPSRRRNTPKLSVTEQPATEQASKPARRRRGGAREKDEVISMPEEKPGEKTPEKEKSVSEAAAGNVVNTDETPLPAEVEKPRKGWWQRF